MDSFYIVILLILVISIIGLGLIVRRKIVTKYEKLLFDAACEMTKLKQTGELLAKELNSLQIEKATLTQADVGYKNTITILTNDLNNSRSLFNNSIKELREKVVTYEESLKRDASNYKLLKENYDKLLNQKKSSEVKLGQIGEHLAPFLRDWPWDSKNFRFIGNPIDGIQFNEDSVVFVEVKTGSSSLSKSQVQIRNLIKQGKVKWAIFRIDENACTLKEESQNEE